MNETEREVPLLSICVPTYNRAQWLRPMLTTVVSQLAAVGSRVEIVVSDNASTDDTAEVVRELQRTLGSIRYNCNDTNIGAEPNYQKSVQELARGRYAWLLGDDDFLVPGTLGKVVNAIERNLDIDYFYVNYQVWKCDVPPVTGAALPQIEADRLNHPHLAEGRVEALMQIVGGDANLFTPISCSIMRREELAQAVSRDPDLEPFATAQSVSPISMHIARHRLQEPAYCFGEPLTLLGTTSSWGKYVPAFTLIVFPELYDHYERHGAPSEAIDVFRRALCGYCGDAYLRMRTDPNVPGREHFSLQRFVRLNWRIRTAYTLHYRVFVQPKYAAPVSGFLWSFAPSKAALHALRRVWHRLRSRPSQKI